MMVAACVLLCVLSVGVWALFGLRVYREFDVDERELRRAALIAALPAKRAQRK